MIDIKTYQDLQKCGLNEDRRIQFIYDAIADHQMSAEYKIGHRAGMFYRHHDPNIEEYQKIVYDIQGIGHVDTISANHKIMSNFFALIINQATEYLLANGISFDDAEIKERLSNNFDHRIKKIAKYAAVDGRAYGYITDNDIIPMCFACQIDGDEPFFVPLKDERTGKLMAGIRYWRLTQQKPLMATLYEVDGFTEYAETFNEDGDPRLEVTQEKTAYIQSAVGNDVQGVYEINGQNYSDLPIIEMKYINNQSALVGNEGTLTAYNMAISGFANQVDWNLLYWIINNADGMSKVDDANFLADLLKSHVLHTSGEATAQPFEITIQHAARAELLDRLRAQIFEDMQGVDVSSQNANMTATEIKSKYANLNIKCDEIESYIDSFIYQMLNVLGYNDVSWHYQRDVTINTTEATNNAIAAAQWLGDEMTTKTLLEIQGKTDEFENIQRQKIADEQTFAE